MHIVLSYFAVSRSLPNKSVSRGEARPVVWGNCNPAITPCAYVVTSRLQISQAFIFISHKMNAVFDFSLSLSNERCREKFPAVLAHDAGHGI